MGETEIQSRRIICLRCGDASHIYEDRHGLFCSRCGPSAKVDYARSATITPIRRSEGGNKP